VVAGRGGAPLQYAAAALSPSRGRQGFFRSRSGSGQPPTRQVSVMSSQRLYKTIYTLAKSINSSLEPSRILADIAEQVTKAIGAKGCFIRLLDAQGDMLLPGASYGLSQRYALKGPVQVEKSHLDQEVLRGNSVHIEDVRSDKRFQYRDEAAAEGLVSLMVMPLKARGEKVMGVLRVYSGEARTFTEDELDFLACIANLSGIALENARMYEALKRENRLAEEYIYRVDEN
jgi:GAF domain-containing protein